MAPALCRQGGLGKVAGSSEPLEVWLAVQPWNGLAQRQKCLSPTGVLCCNPVSDACNDQPEISMSKKLWYTQDYSTQALIETWDNLENSKYSNNSGGGLPSTRDLQSDCNCSDVKRCIEYATNLIIVLNILFSRPCSCHRHRFYFQNNSQVLGTDSENHH